MSSKSIIDRLKDHPATIIFGLIATTLGLIATCIAIFTFTTGFPSIWQVLANLNPGSSTPVSKIACPYAGNSDEATITNIIQAEAEAVNKEDISIIRNIFESNALIRFEGNGTEWNDPIVHYTEEFENADVVNAVHFNIQPTGQGIVNDTAWFISGSSGTTIYKDGKRLDYHNELGMDTWVLKKNNLGCWVIVKFTYH